jgi:hypothetical protein
MSLRYSRSNVHRVSSFAVSGKKDGPSVAEAQRDKENEPSKLP